MTSLVKFQLLATADTLCNQHTMDGSENRLFRWTKPEWINNAAVRTAGVYTSGGLVRERETTIDRCSCPM